MKIIKGNFIFTSEKEKFETYESSYMAIENGKIKEISHEKINCECEIIDYSDCLIIPSFSDIHAHAPQYPNCGIGYSMELLPWLNTYTFPMESRYKDLEFAEENYKKFVNDLWKYGSLRSCIFSTIHKESTELLFNLFIKAGIGAYIGKVNMDRNSIPTLQEETEKSINDTIELIEKFYDKNENVKYILTPRFVPSTTGKLMKGLGELVEKYNIPVQSHLDENRSEVAWVKELHPEIESFAKVYDYYGLMPKDRTIMAHCIYTTEEEQKLLKEKNIKIAHSPQSNFNLASGIMPLRKYFEMGLNIGLASDVSGGHTLDMRSHIIACIEASKMYFVANGAYKPISFAEGFYLATKGSGSFFGKCGSFEKEYSFDALIIKRGKNSKGKFSLEEELEKFIYAGNEESIIARYLNGNKIEKPFM